MNPLALGRGWQEAAAWSPRLVWSTRLSSACCLQRAVEALSVWPGGFALLWGTDATATECWTRWSIWSWSPAQLAVLQDVSCNLLSGRPGAGLVLEQ